MFLSRVTRGRAVLQVLSASIQPVRTISISRAFSVASATPHQYIVSPGLRHFQTPHDMHQDILRATEVNDVVRNYTGVIKDMNDCVIETELFPRAALEFYTRLNLNQEVSEEMRQKYYDAARGGGQGDYREGIQEKIENVVDCLTRFPQSKRAVLPIPFASYGSMEIDHTKDHEAKCLRELHFYPVYDSPTKGQKNVAEATTNRLGCTGFMRAQAGAIFPKNIHFIGELMKVIGGRLGMPVGPYTHFVTTLVGTRAD